MSTLILVAYATRYGSTQEVAETIATTLREHELQVEFRPLRAVQSLSEYSAVVMGAPLYMFHWHKDALHFLTQHRDALVKMPVAIFALGPWHEDEKEFQTVRAQLDKELAKFSWLTPRATEIFGGKFDPNKLTFPHTWIPAIKSMPASDIRDWNKIRAWANELAAMFQPAMVK